MSASDPNLTEFVRNGSEQAFARLLERHMGLVYATARRVLGAAREDAAADVAQTVFCQLAGQARRLPADLVVSVWLHAQARRAALNVIRSESRRAARERTAAELMQQNAPDDPAEMNAALMPHIDSALAELSKTDQRALALRFFEQCPFQEMGERLGLSPDAARKRLTRALETLRARLSRRGVTLSAAALTLWLTDESVRAAPASVTAATLSAALPAAAAATTGAGGGGLFSFLTIMSGTKFLMLGAAIGLVSGGLWVGLAGDSSSPVASNSSAASPSPAPPSAPGGSGAAVAQRFAVPSPAATAEGLLAQFQEIIGAPDTELNRLRLKAWLEQMPADLWKPLVALADASFSDVEKRKFWDLASQWAKVDPEAAMLSFLKTSGQPSHWLGNEIRTVSFGGSLAINVFRVWYEDTPDKAGDWLLKHQNDPQWAEMLPGAIRVIGEKLAASSPTDNLAWAARLEGDELRTAAMEAVWSNLSREEGKSDWSNVCTSLLKAEDREFGNMALRKALRAWISVEANGEPGFAPAERWMASLSSPRDRREAAELILSNVMQPRPQFNSLQQPDKALAELLASGPETASREAARLITEAGPLQSGASDWLLPLLQGPERDPAILHAARLLADGDERVRFTNPLAANPNPAAALAWAVELSDPAVRDPLIRDLLGKQLTERSTAGQSADAVVDWIEKTSLAPEVRAVLRTSLKEFQALSKP
ncbi:MAG: sigma-70 family RNA polymerase sigma factor [Verrucomicrobiota bacterium]